MTNPLDQDTEVLFLVDASRGVTQDIFKKEKEFVKRLSTHFNISTNGPYGSVFLYDNSSHLVVGFGQPNLFKRLDRATLTGMPRRIDKVLQQVALLFSRSVRRGRKIVVLLMAGKQAVAADVRPLSEAVRPLQRLKVQTFVVTIGRGIETRNILTIVDSRNDLFMVPDINRLPSLSKPFAKHVQEKPGKWLCNTYQARCHYIFNITRVKSCFIQSYFSICDYLELF